MRLLLTPPVTGKYMTSRNMSFLHAASVCECTAVIPSNCTGKNLIFHIKLSLCTFDAQHCPSALFPKTSLDLLTRTSKRWAFTPICGSMHARQESSCISLASPMFLLPKLAHARRQDGRRSIAPAIFMSNIHRAPFVAEVRRASATRFLPEQAPGQACACAPRQRRRSPISTSLDISKKGLPSACMSGTHLPKLVLEQTLETQEKPFWHTNPQDPAPTQPHFSNVSLV